MQTFWTLHFGNFTTGGIQNIFVILFKNCATTSLNFQKKVQFNCFKTGSTSNYFTISCSESESCQTAVSLVFK